MLEEQIRVVWGTWKEPWVLVFSSYWACSQTPSPSLLSHIWGHMTEFWPVEREQRWIIPISRTSQWNPWNPVTVIFFSSFTSLLAAKEPTDNYQSLEDFRGTKWKASGLWVHGERPRVRTGGWSVLHWHFLPEHQEHSAGWGQKERQGWFFLKQPFHHLSYSLQSTFPLKPPLTHVSFFVL